MPRIASTILMLLCLAGCAGSDTDLETAAEHSPAADVPLTAADLDRFLAVVQHHSRDTMPEFTPLENEEPLDFDLPAAELVTVTRRQCGQLFDARRQGALWERDEKWKEAFAGQKISGARFALLVRSVSLAIMRVRLDARIDVAKLVVEANRQVEQIVAVMDEIDAVPSGERSRDDVEVRTRSALRLARAAALLEFAELVEKVPPASAAMARRYSKQLKPLLPSLGSDDLLAELSALATGESSDVEPVGFDGSTRKPAPRTKR
jgi:hypothetical protein